jgi:hypothetical protein
MNAQRGTRGIAVRSLTSTLGGVGRESHIPAALPPGNDPVPIVQEMLCGPQGRSGRVWRITLPPGFDLRTVQPVASFEELVRV